MRAPWFSSSLVPLLCATGCAAIPEGRSAVDSVRIVGAHALDPGELATKLATQDSPKFLGLLRGVANDYTIYDDAVVQRDLARVERYYRGRGFLEAHARVARVVPTARDHVRVEIVVDEGQPVVNAGASVEGLDGLPAPVADAARVALAKALPKSARFDEDAYGEAQRAVLRAMTDRGYAYAAVHAEARVDLASHTVDYAFRLEPGPPAVYGPITFVGLDPDGAGPAPQEIGESILRRVMALREGSSYSTAQIDSATQALLDLEVFSGVHIAPALSEPGRRVVPLTVQVEPTKLRTLRLGVGGEFDETKTEAHVLVGWEDHDFLGGLRDLSVDFRPGLVLYPTSIGNITRPTDLFAEERLHLRFRQPGFLEARTNFIAQPELNAYPLLVESNPRSSEPVVGYVEPKVSVGVERRIGGHFFAKLVYNFQGEIPFPYKRPLDPTLPALDPLLPTVLLSFPQLVMQLDFKDDPIHPHAGFAADADVQVAGDPFGVTARDVRIQPDVEGYVPITRNLTFAVSATLGMLFPFNYGDTVRQLPGSTATASTDVDRDIETVYFRGFFSGGPNSNRGYPLRGIAPHGYVPFLNPLTAAMMAANNCDPNKQTAGAPIASNPNCSSPIGGFTQWEASAELRIAIAGPFGAAIFCDAGDVSQHVLPDPGSLRLNYLHMSCGVGGRYDTPVGPIRLDVGYRIPWLQIVGKVNGQVVTSETRAAELDPTFGLQPQIFGQPIAIAFGIGEAF